jgi:hypothetical protein
MRRRDSRDGVRAQLSPSHYHAGEFGGFGTTILHRGMARRGDILVAGCWSPSRQRYPLYAVRDPAHQQAIAQPGTGSAVSRSRATARTLGQIACREKSAQRIGAAAFPVLGDLQEGYLRT